MTESSAPLAGTGNTALEDIFEAELDARIRDFEAQGVDAREARITPHDMTLLLAVFGVLPVLIAVVTWVIDQ